METLPSFDFFVSFNFKKFKFRGDLSQPVISKVILMKNSNNLRCRVCGNRAYFTTEGGRVKCQICGAYVDMFTI